MKNTIVNHQEFLNSILNLLVFMLCIDQIATAQVKSNEPSSTLNSTFNISGNGAAGYTLNIEVPPGTNGVTPQISIVYSSQAGNGLLGKGFSLSGISSINRVGATYEEDGFKGSVNYDGNDRFTIGSSRLMRIGGNVNGYYSEGAIYHTEIEAWAKLIASNTSGSGPGTFDVTSNKGISYQFGGTPDSKVYAIGKNFTSGPKKNSLRKWYINREVDLNGNSIVYNYTQSPLDSTGNIITIASNRGQVYPNQILYTSNSTNRLSAQRIIQFYYEGRPDSVVQFIGGSIIQSLVRLSNIKTYIITNTNDTQLIRNYKITYENIIPLNSSRVVSICQYSPNNSLLAFDSFNWTNSPNKFFKDSFSLSELSTSGGWQGDFNGDGKTDLFLSSGNTLNGIYIADESGFTNKIISPSITLSSLQLVADFNGDGRTDLVNGTSSNCKLYLSNGTEFKSSIPIQDSLFLPSTINSNSVWSADFNGDGKSDIISKSGTYVYISFSNGKGFNKFIPIHFPALNGKTCLTSDFNGDGLADIYVSDSIFLSNCSINYSFKSGIFARTSLDKNSSFFADFNGDGLGDLIGKSGSNYQIYFSNGSGLESPLTFPAGDIVRSNSWLGDYNGDGLMDLLSSSNNKYAIYYANGISFNYVPISYFPLSSHKWIGDFNGDNITDIFDAGSQNIYINSDSLNPQKNFNQLPDQVYSIQNNIGGVVNIKYQPITNDSIYSKISSTDSSTLAIGIFNIYNSLPLSPQQGSNYPIKLTQRAMYVTSNYSAADGRGNIYHYHYKYDGAKIDLTGQGWLGFHSTSETDSMSNTISKTYYLQKFPLTGKVDSTIVFDLNNNVLSTQKNEYNLLELQNITNSKIYNIQINKVNSYHYDYGKYNYTSSIKYKYDTFGNPILITNVGDLAKPQNTLYKLVNYLNDTITWLIGLPTKMVQSSDSLGKLILTQTTNTYYPNSNQINIQSQWLNTTDTWLSTRYIYDAFGNNTIKIDASMDSTSIEYDPIYHTFPITNYYPKNQWGKILSTKSVYNPAFGVRIESFDANGNRFGILLDQFGRDSVMTGPDSTSINQIALEIVSYSKSNPTGILTSKVVRNNWEGTSWDSTESYIDGLERNYVNVWRGTDHRHILQQIEYNNKNQVTKKSNPYFINDSIIWTTYSYDPYGRLTSIHSPDSTGTYNTTRFSYSDKKMEICVASGKPDSAVSSYIFEYYNSKKKIIQHINNLSQTSEFFYDLLGRDTLATDPGGHSINQQYNSVGDKVLSFNPSSGKTYALYDYLNRAITTVDNKGDTLISIYDGSKRLIKQKFPDGTSYQYLYDLAYVKNGLGQIGKIILQDTGLFYSYQYTPYSKKSNITFSYKNWSFTENYSFNPDQSISKLIYPDSTIAFYSYYQNGMPKSISLLDQKNKNIAPTPIFDYLAYNAQSNGVLLQYGNQVQRNNSFLPSGQLHQYKITSPNNDILVNQLYDWNNVNEIVLIADSVNALYSQYFKYDKAGRLDSARGAYGNYGFAYDNSGNLLKKDSISFEYTNYQVTSGTKNGNKIYSALYDLNGNQTQRVMENGKKLLSEEYKFDALDRLTTISVNNTPMFSFMYNHLGNRIEKRDLKNKVSTMYISPNYELTRTPDSVIMTKYVFTENKIVATITNASPNKNKSLNNGYPGIPTSGIIFFHQDLVNSTKVTTSPSGLLQNQVYYKPFGEVYQFTGKNNIRYTFGTKEFDASGLYYFSARYYDPFTTRFISADNQLAGGKFRTDAFNRYAYTINNPIKFSDPSGHDPLTDVKIGLLFTAEAVLDIAADGALTPEELEIDADFYSALRASRRVYDETQGRSGISQDEAIKAFKGKRDANRGRSLDERTSNRDRNANTGRPNAYKPITSNGYGEPGIDNHGNSIYANKSPLQLQDEQTTFARNYENQSLSFGSTRDGNAGITQLLNESTGLKPYKFTLSFDDYQISIGTHDKCTHAALESQQGGGHVYTAGHVWMDNGQLQVVNETGHYQTSFGSLKMSDPVWRTLGFTNIEYIEF